MLGVLSLLLVGAVLAAVHHAEVVAHRVGEPFGSLVLAVAVTVIEVALIVSLMVSGGKDTSTLARDTVFAAVMISLNGIVGLCLLVGALRHHLAVFNPEGTGAALSTVIALAAVCLVVPRFTTTEAGPEFSGAQLAFAAVASLALYGMFVFTQTIRHRDFFLPVENGTRSTTDGDGHADPPTVAGHLDQPRAAAGLAGQRGRPREGRVARDRGAARPLGFPHAFVGVVIALLVLLPESIAAIRAAARDRVQISLNLAYGSAMASIGLTIPTIAVASIWLDGPLRLGLEPIQIVLLFITVVVSILTVVPGRAKPLQGGVHLVLLAAFLFLSISP